MQDSKTKTAELMIPLKVAEVEGYKAFKAGFSLGIQVSRATIKKAMKEITQPVTPTRSPQPKKTA